MMDNIIKKYREHEAYLYSIVQINNGQAIAKKIIPSSNCHDSYSIAKVFTMTAIGMLYDDKKISLDECAYEILEEDFPNQFDPQWKKVTIHHLLSHKIGLEKPSDQNSYMDIDVDDVTLYPTNDYLHYAVSVPIPKKLDAEYVYSDIPHYILSRVVAKKTGRDLCEFLQMRLFNPLKFREVAWSRCPNGYSIGATGLYLWTEDMAKLGAVYLNNGVYEGKRIVSSKWCDIVFEKGYELKKRPGQCKAWSKGGMYGQNLYISKEEGIVIAWHGFGYAGVENDIMDELEM